MALGFLLIDCAPGQEAHVLKHLHTLPQLVEAQPLFGEFDILAKLEAPDFNELGHVIASRIQSIDGIVATKTLAAGPVEAQ